MGASTETHYARSFGFAGSLMQMSYTARLRKPAQVMLVPMIDIFTVLVTFLLMTAVFSRITILELDLPSSASSGPPTPPAFRLEVIVRQAGFELTNGGQLIAAIPKVNGEYDMQSLSELALALKREHSQVDDASVLMEQDIPYDHLIQVMDAIRSTRQLSPAGAVKVPLFAHVAVGEAP
jgi:biopolymer transport protein ExbD